MAMLTEFPLEDSVVGRIGAVWNFVELRTAGLFVMRGNGVTG
jgi:hypothetical protein